MSVAEIRASDRNALPARPWAHLLPPPIVMMGVPIDQLNTQQALEIIEQMISSGKPHVIATANVDFLALVHDDDVLQGILQDADLILCDGTPLIWMSKWLGDPLPERLAGSDMVPLLLDLAQEKGHRVFFLGGRDEVVAVAEEKIQARWPRLQIAGMYSPPFAPLEKMDHADICRRIREAKADMLFVSFGCPKQEKWLAMNFREAGVPVTMGVGATIDFLAGAVKRAPVWMRKCGLEWFFRVIQEPRRLAKRYINDIRIVIPGLIKQYYKTRNVLPPAQSPSPSATSAHANPPSSPISDISHSLLLIRLPARLDAIAARDATLWPQENSPSVIIDASETVFLDSTGSGKLARLARMTRELGGKCYLAHANETVLRTLDLMKLRNLFVEVSSVDEAQKLIGK